MSSQPIACQCWFISFFLSFLIVSLLLLFFFFIGIRRAICPFRSKANERKQKKKTKLLLQSLLKRRGFSIFELHSKCSCIFLWCHVVTNARMKSFFFFLCLWKSWKKQNYWKFNWIELQKCMEIINCKNV